MQRMAKLARHGYYRRVSPADAWAVLDRLRAAGWSCTAIASATGIPTSTISKALKRGQAWQWGAHHAAAIVNHGDPTEGQIGTTGSTRRLRALAALGWTLDALADHTGVGFTTLAAVRAGTTTRLGVALAATIDRAYAELSMIPGGSAPARAYAAGQGWVPPLAWDDIDDPGERPKLGRRGPGHPHGTTVEDLEHLLHGQAWTWAGLTDRLGVTKSAIEHLCARHDRRDLLRRIQLQDPTHRDSGPRKERAA